VVGQVEVGAGLRGVGEGKGEFEGFRGGEGQGRYVWEG